MYTKHNTNTQQMHHRKALALVVTQAHRTFLSAVRLLHLVACNAVEYSSDVGVYRNARWSSVPQPLFCGCRVVVPFGPHRLFCRGIVFLLGLVFFSGANIFRNICASLVSSTMLGAKPVDECTVLLYRLTTRSIILVQLKSCVLVI